VADIEVTGLEAGEELAFLRCVVRNFHEDADDDTLLMYQPVMELDRTLVARDGGEMVANYAIDTRTISVPGGASIPCAAVTAVGVAQTHRRRGLLRRMMARGLDDAAARGEPVAALYASESRIYGRFGFGITAPTVTYRIDRAFARFHDRVDDRLVRPATVDEALTHWPGILDAAVRDRRGGCVSRDAAHWRLWLTNDPVSWRDGASTRRLVHVPGRGYAAYRVKDDWNEGLPAGEVRVQELVAGDAEAEQALWQHVLDIDLTATTTGTLRSPDDALAWQLTDPLRLRRTDGPPLYTRLIDVPAALAARSYHVSDSLVLGVHDAFRDQSGRYRLEAGPDGSACERTDAAPDLELSVEALASLWLGGVRTAPLLAAGRMQEHSAGAAARLGRVLTVDDLPWTPFEF
jgi:predicted acetyltransferase